MGGFERSIRLDIVLSDVRSRALGAHIIDTRNGFYLYQVDSSRWHAQIIGPRIPASWLHRLDDESSDDVNTDDLETWWEPDLCGWQQRTS